MFLGPIHQYRYLYFWLSRLKVDEKYYSGWSSAGRPGLFGTKSNSAQAEAGARAELGKMMKNYNFN